MRKAGFDGQLVVMVLVLHEVVEGKLGLRSKEVIASQ
jgi:hypothetical protein